MYKKLRTYTIYCVSAIVICISYYPSTLYSEQGQSSLSSLNVACNPDKPMAFTGETISLRAWATSPTGQSLQYTWSVTAGTIEGNGSEVQWNFKGVKPKIYKATVQVHGPKEVSSDCSIQVIVSFPPLILKGGSRETGRSFLLPDQIEAKGYGLYSYLLLGAEPDDTNRDRYIRAIKEYLKFPAINKLEKRVKRGELNITYLPVDDSPSQDIAAKLEDKLYEPVAEWVLKHYDYARARALLRNLSGDHRNGPYIISFLKPLSGDTFEPPYLYQDQSNVPPHLVSLWMKEFLNQAAQERYWEEKTGRRLALKIRTTIGILAIGLPEVKNSLSGWIAWVSDTTQGKNKLLKAIEIAQLDLNDN